MSTIAVPVAVRATTARIRTLANHTGIVMARELRPVLADPFSLIFGMVQPLVFLGLFGPLLAGSVGDLVGGSVWQWFVPSILVMTVLFVTSTTGANLLFELQTGAHERMLVAPVSRSALLVGRSLKEMAPLAGQSLIIVLVMVPFGFRPDPLGGLVAIALLAVFGVGLGSLSYALALAVRKQDWMFWAVQQALLYPLMILSGMLLPIEAGPGWMQAIAKANPLTYVVDAARALFAGSWDAAVGWGWLAAGLTAAAGLTVGIRAMLRSAD